MFPRWSYRSDVQSLRRFLLDIFPASSQTKPVKTQSRCWSAHTGYFPHIGARDGRESWQEELSGSALGGSDSLDPVDQKPKAQTVSGSGRTLPLVSHRLLFPLGQHVSFGEKVIACPLAWGSAKFSVALCLFFCHTKEWKGVFPQPVRLPSPVLLFSTHMCFLFFSFTGQGVPLSPEEGDEKHMWHWIPAGLMVITR